MAAKNTNSISPEERARRMQVLQRQKESQEGGGKYTDAMAASQLGLLIGTWRTWKRNQKPKPRKPVADSPERGGGAEGGWSPTNKRVAMAIANLTEEFDEGQRAVATLRKIRKLIDEAIGE